MNLQRSLLGVTLGIVAFTWGIEQSLAQPVAANPSPLGDAPAASAPSTLRSMTPAMRAAAAARAAAAHAGPLAQYPPSEAAGTMTLLTGPRAAPPPGGTPNYFGPEGNWAFTPVIPKFVDTLPGLTPAGANNLGQYIPVGVADTTTFAGSDYYEIAVVEYSQQMHSQLPPTRLRGYVQLETPAVIAAMLAAGSPSKHIALTYPNGNPILDLAGQQVFAVDNPRYLGPLIIAQRDFPVRVKFTNYLPIGAGGDLFIPTDTTTMGAGMGPDGMNMFTQNRATLHLHGGATPWISDGTPHQWTVPANETTPYPKGVGVQPVPDMWYDSAAFYAVIPGVSPTPPSATATNDPGPGSLTFFYTNQQSARLMFYHDHAYGITRLNVYAGEAAGYLVQDTAEANLVAAGNLPAAQIPLVIQDKTFVDAATIDSTDPTWNWGTAPPTRNTGNLWFPHVYMPNQNPSDMSGANNFGRWDYGPWFWPPLTAAAGLVHGEIPSPGPGLPATPGIPNPTMVPEGFMDTPIVNGAAYPHVPVLRQAYRLRILNACNDRFLNLQLYYADPLSVVVTAGGSGYTTPPTVTFTGGGASTQGTATATITNIVNSLLLTNPGVGYTSAPTVRFTGGGGTGAAATAAITSGVVTGLVLTSGGEGYTSAPTVTFIGGGATTPATATATITGVVNGITVTSAGGGYTSAPTVTITGGGGTGATAMAAIDTEVRMIPAVAGPTIPPYYPTMDGRAGGVPDPTMSGPTMIQYGTEGGFLTSPVVLNNVPIGYDYNRRSITVLNVLEHTLFLGPAERADVIVDFSQVPSTVSNVILYNDSPAPVPAFDPRFDYYTGDPDQSATGNNTGGAPSTLPGFGPNTRTILRFGLASGTPAPAFDLAALQAAWPAAYTASLQPASIVPSTAFGDATDVYSTIQATSLDFTGKQGMLAAVTVTNGGAGYSATPSITFNGGGGTGAAATATVTAGVITQISLTNAGLNYTSPPTVVINDATGTGASAVASLGMPMLPKAIQELFELNYGRMNATLGVELPFTNFTIQTTIPLGYVDPATELLQDGVPQVWKITHNGVDTHAIHFHLFNVQLINRVGWDGMIKPPEANELGWKETVRMNPLEDAIVALMPIAPVVPFPVPESTRPLDVTAPVNSTIRVTSPVDGNFINVVNALTNFGWEYVWHCHLLGHEENDMMRPMVLSGVVTPQVAPAEPSGLGAIASAPQQIDLAWADNSTNEWGFRIERADPIVGGGTGPFAPVQTVAANTTAWSDTTVSSAATYSYQVIAFNASGDSAPSNTATATTPNGPPGAPSNLTATDLGPNGVNLAWTLHSTNETAIQVERAIGAGAFSALGSALPPGTTTYSDTTVVPNTSYSYRVSASNALGSSLPSNVATVLTPVTPLLSASVTATPGSGHTPVQVVLLANATGGSGTYSYAWSSNPPVTFSAPNAVSTFATLTVPATYTFTLTVNDGSSTVSGVATVTAFPPLAVTVSATPSSGQAPLTVSLAATAVGGSGTYSYAWSSSPPATFSAPTAANTTVTMASAGDYTISWAVSDVSTAATGTTLVTVTPTPSAAPSPGGSPPPATPTPTPAPLCGLGFSETMLVCLTGLMFLRFTRRRRPG
ncbi:MAG TPA: hypothetical protein VMV94_13765 [Phycisphaerae bacterium]|nr:hypothetical protein [Phycisphaerae bacterium]